MSIVIVFPVNNPFSKQNTKPVVLAGLPYILKSKLNIKVISPFTGTPIDNVDVHMVDKSYANKKKYNNAVLQVKYLQDAQIIEVHQDIKLATLIKKVYPEKKIFLIKHCNSIVNKLLERIKIFRVLFYYKYIKDLDGIYCVSRYMQDLFKKQYPRAENKFILLYNTYAHIEQVIDYHLHAKENIIVFVGKPSKHKGFIEFSNTVISLLNQHKNYQIMIIAAFFSSKPKYRKEFNSFLANKEVQNLIKQDRIIIKINLSVQEVFKETTKAKILVVPSKIPEGFGFVALEAAMAKCAIISSGQGALAEITNKYCLYLKTITAEEIRHSLIQLIRDEQLIADLGNAVFHYAQKKFNPNEWVEILDRKRREYFE